MTPPNALASSSNASANVTYTSSTMNLQKLGTVSLSAAPTTTSAASALAVGPSSVRFGAPPVSFARGGLAAASTINAAGAVPSGNVIAVQRDKQKTGFEGISGPQQASVNGFDLEPPDQGTCAGPSNTEGPVTVEIINNALSAYTPSGTQVLPVTPTFTLFDQPSTTFLSDPRCYFDVQTQRWFFTELSIANSGTASTQFVAVSQSADPFGSYTVFSIDTTDTANPLGDCPCFGDFDQIGADANGFYISTSEFSLQQAYPATYFNGSVVYAISKSGLANAASGGRVPSVARYQITADSFGTSANGANSGPYHVSPASTPPDGSYANNTEYFVESNSNQLSDSHLIVYALTGTDALNHGGVPSLRATEIVSEGYAFPPNATQKKGPLPYGHANYRATSPTGLQADFNAVQQVTFTNGQLYGALDTGVGSPTPVTDGIAWFDLGPSMESHALSVQVSAQGYVNSSQNLLYPDVVVNGSGQGYIVFSVSGLAEHPSPGYVAFAAQSGPTGDIRLATEGSAPEDGFTCYPAPPASYPPQGGCRWGDYSGGAEWNGQFFMMAEYIPPSARDTYVDWGTYVWTAPSP
ncbi:MAG: hypothetical protein ACYDB2_03370 [Acidimicrobiales bacterium]